MSTSHGSLGEYAYFIEPDTLLKLPAPEEYADDHETPKGGDDEDDADGDWPLFKNGAQLRQTPTDDKFFDFEPTSIKVTGKTNASWVAVHTVNSLLKAFQKLRAEEDNTLDEASPGALKEEEHKFSFKATAFKGDEHCEFKARFYADPGNSNAFTVELVHRAGNDRVFRAVYAKVKNFYKVQEKNQFIDKSEPLLNGDFSEPQDFFCSAPGSGTDSAAAEAAALMDTAGFAEVQELQAAAARSVSRAACDPKQAERLCAGRLFDGLRVLLKSDSLEVLWPTARSLEQLKKQPVEQKWLNELRSDMEMKANNDKTPAAVKKVLGRVLRKEPQGKNQAEYECQVGNIEDLLSLTPEEKQNLEKGIWTDADIQNARAKLPGSTASGKSQKDFGEAASSGKPMSPTSASKRSQASMDGQMGSKNKVDSSTHQAATTSSAQVGF